MCSIVDLSIAFVINKFNRQVAVVGLRFAKCINYMLCFFFSVCQDDTTDL